MSAQKRLCNESNVIDNRPRRGAPVLLAARALAHRARSAHFTQAAEINAPALRAGLDEVQIWTAAHAMRLTPTGLSRLL